MGFPIWWEGPNREGEIEQCTYASQDIRGNADKYDKAHEDNKKCYELYKKASDGDESALKQVSPDYFWLWEKDYPERPSVQDCWDSGNSKSYYNSDGVLWTSDKWVSSYQAQLLLFKEGYRPYIPFKGRTSVFFSNQWLMADLYGSEYGTNQQSVKGFGMPKFRMQYAKYLKDAGRDDDYEN